MEAIIEFIKLIFYSLLIVIISKYILVTIIRKLAINLNLKPKTIGSIAGYTTSIPELLTVCISSYNGLIGTSIYNILSSNIINLVQYFASIFLNKNKKAFKNKAIRIDLILVVLTILIPIFIIKAKISLSIAIVPIFIILYLLFKYIDNNVHKLYLQKEDGTIEEKEVEIGSRSLTSLYIIFLIVTGVTLFIIGQYLGNTLEILCNRFNISQVYLGILLGFVTSLPELITFFEAQKHYKENEKDILGVIEATNNLFTSNVLNLFIIQVIGIIIFNVIT